MAVSRINEAGLNVNQYGNRNVIINGAMQCWQRATAATTTANKYSTVDRWKHFESGAGAFTTEQSTDHPTGTGYSLKCQVTTADTSIAAGEYAFTETNLEGQNLQQLQYGTSTAKDVTVSFWVKSNKTGIYCAAVYKHAGSGTAYMYRKEYTIDAANTWEKKVVTISPTAGSTALITASAGAIPNSNAAGLSLVFGLAWGTNYHGTDDTWQTGSGYGTSNQVNWMDSTSNNFYLAEVQLEVGDTATDFEHRTFADELIKCQRYYTKYFETGGSGSNAYLRYGTGQAQTSTIAEIPINSHTVMRADPALETTGTFSNYAIWARGSIYALTGLVVEVSGHSNGQLFTLTATVASGLNAGDSVSLLNNNSTTAFLAFDAEL